MDDEIPISDLCSEEIIRQNVVVPAVYDIIELSWEANQIHRNTTPLVEKPKITTQMAQPTKRKLLETDMIDLEENSYIASETPISQIEAWLRNSDLQSLRANFEVSRRNIDKI